VSCSGESNRSQFQIGKASRRVGGRVLALPPLATNHSPLATAFSNRYTARVESALTHSKQTSLVLSSRYKFVPPGGVTSWLPHHLGLRHSNRNTSETGFPVTHSKQTTVVLSNRNKKTPPRGATNLQTVVRKGAAQRAKDARDGRDHSRSLTPIRGLRDWVRDENERRRRREILRPEGGLRMTGGRKGGSDLSLTSSWINRRTLLPPGLNQRGALIVPGRIDEILAWEKSKEQERDERFVELGQYLCEERAGQYWRLENLKSFDEFLEKRFPESRRKAYYLMAIHEHLTRVPKRQLREVGWTKATELIKVVRRDGAEFDCATWLHKAKELPKEDFKRAVECHLTGKETEPWEIIYFKLYKSQLPVVEQALETAALMLGTNKSRGYCLEMICADFLAGAALEIKGSDQCIGCSGAKDESFAASEQRASRETRQDE
jgi:hypothetical protein